MVTRIPAKPLRTGGTFGAEPSVLPQQIFPTHVNTGIWRPKQLLKTSQPPNMSRAPRRIRVTASPKKTTVNIEDMLPAPFPDPPLPRFLVKQMRKM